MDNLYWGMLWHFENCLVLQWLVPFYIKILWLFNANLIVLIMPATIYLISNQDAFSFALCILIMFFSSNLCRERWNAWKCCMLMTNPYITRYIKFPLFFIDIQTGTWPFLEVHCPADRLSLPFISLRQIFGLKPDTYSLFRSCGL